MYAHQRHVQENVKSEGLVFLIAPHANIKAFDRTRSHSGATQEPLSQIGRIRICSMVSRADLNQVPKLALSLRLKIKMNLRLCSPGTYPE